MKKWQYSAYAALLSLLILWICAIIPVYRSAASFIPAESDRRHAAWIVDAGHGGDDGGAVSGSGAKESELNLDVSLHIRDLGRFLGKTVYLTRESEELAYPPEAITLRARKQWDTRRRAEYINAIPNALLISIHQNYYPTMTPSGAQVFYGSGEVSRELGERLQKQLVSQLDPQNRRVAEPADSEIYLLSHVFCPAVLVECGFLSNPRESGLLLTESYRLKLSAVIAAGLIQSSGEMI